MNIKHSCNDTFMLFIIFILCSPLVAAYASTGREEGLRSKSTLAYLEGGGGQESDFFVYVICGCPHIVTYLVSLESATTKKQ